MTHQLMTIRGGLTKLGWRCRAFAWAMAMVAWVTFGVAAQAQIDVTLPETEEASGIRLPDLSTGRGQGYQAQPWQQPPDTFTLPSGTPFSAVLQTPISTVVNQTGDIVEARIMREYLSGSRKAVSRQDVLLGRVIVLKPPMQGQNGIVGIAFDELVQTTGDRLPVVTQVKGPHLDTATGQAFWGGELTSGTRYKKVVFGVLGVGNYARYAATGPRQMGQHTTLPMGEQLNITLIEPLTFVFPPQ